MPFFFPRVSVGEFGVGKGRVGKIIKKGGRGNGAGKGEGRDSPLYGEVLVKRFVEDGEGVVAVEVFEVGGLEEAEGVEAGEEDGGCGELLGGC